MAREDLQMLVPLAYDDPFGVWPAVLEYVTPNLPLKDVVCKSPTSGTLITIPSLPIRFMPSNAGLFKDTDHPFRWFLAPYVDLYLVRAENLDVYKTIKPAIKAWVDARTAGSSSTTASTANSMKKSSWLLLYVPVGVPSSLDAYTKVYARLSSDFYLEKAGDHSLFLLLRQEYQAQSLSPPAQHASSFADFIARIKKYIVASFQQRTTLYDADIRRLDSFRGTPQLDFRQLFLVKESLALMYQMMQLPSESFIQYEELEALLAFAPPGHLPDNDWPMVLPESSKSASKHQAEAAADASLQGGGSSLATASATAAAKTAGDLPDETHVFATPCRLGDEVLVYSINTSRMKILKNKMGVAELHRYLFARQMFFLTILKNATNFAQKGLAFLHTAMANIDERLRKRQNPIVADTSYNIELRKRQANLWGVCAAIQVVKACKEQLLLPSQPISSTSSREPSQHLCEILMFTYSMIKKITSISNISARNSLHMALEYSSWFDYPGIPAWSADGQPKTCEPQLLVMDDTNNFVSGQKESKLLDAFTDKFHAAAAAFVGDVGTVEIRVEAELIVLFLKIVERMQLAAGRTRSAALVKLQLADVLLHVGAYKNATKAFAEILWDSESTAKSETNASVTLSRWNDFRFTILRKILLCARLSEDRSMYMFTALHFVEPCMLMHAGSSKVWIKAILNDVSKLSVISAQQASSTTEAAAKINKLVIPFSQFFTTSISFNVQLEKMPKMINDEVAVVTVARVHGGVTQTLHLNISSSIPETITVDSLIVTYGAFKLLQATALSAKGVGDIFGELGKDNMFECTAVSPSGGPLSIYPGEQVISLQFRAPCTGEYGLVKLHMSMGPILLQDNLSCSSLADLQKFSQTHTLIRVEQPPNLFGLKVESAPFSPAGQVDDVHVSFRTLEGDQLTGLRVWAIPVVPGETSLSEQQDEELRQDFLRADDTWSNKLQPPTPPPSHIQFPISFEKVSSWRLNRDTSGGGGGGGVGAAAPPKSAVAVAKKEPAGLEHLSFSPLRGWSEIDLVIPFTAEPLPSAAETAATTHNRKTSGSSNNKVAIVIILQGVLVRQDCAIAFDTRSECSVQISEGLNIQATPAGLLLDEFFLQCVLFNTSPVPLTIKSYSLTCGSQWKVLEGPPELSSEEISATQKANRQNFLVLHPGSEFHAAFRVKINKLGGGKGDTASAQATFSFQRSSGQYGEQASWIGGRQFRIAVPIIRPPLFLADKGAPSTTDASVRFSSIFTSYNNEMPTVGRLVEFAHTLEIVSVRSTDKDQSSTMEIVIKCCENDSWVPVGQTKQVVCAERDVEAHVPDGIRSFKATFRTTSVPVVVGVLHHPPIFVRHRRLDHRGVDDEMSFALVYPQHSPKVTVSL